MKSNRLLEGAQHLKGQLKMQLSWLTAHEQHEVRGIAHQCDVVLVAQRPLFRSITDLMRKAWP